MARADLKTADTSGTILSVKLAALVLVLALTFGCGARASPVATTAPEAVVPHVVELTGGGDPAKYDDLAAGGAVLVPEPHLGGDRYLVRMTATTASRVRAMAGVAAVEPLPASARYHAPRFAGTDGPVAVVIDLFEGVAAAPVVTMLEAWGASPELAGATVRASISRPQLESLAARPEVRWIEPR